MREEQQGAGDGEIDVIVAEMQANPWPADIDAARARLDSEASPIAAGVAASRLSAHGVPCQLLTPAKLEAGRIILYLHGGGFVYGSLDSHAGMASHIALAAGSALLQVDYRLAPEHRFPAPVQDACAAYAWLLMQGYAAHGITILGDSAGGGLVLSAMLALKQAGIALPGAAVCISPWVDMEFKGDSFLTRQQIDPLVSHQTCAIVTALYMDGQDRRQPAASPLHGDLAGFPPLLIHIGEREILFSDAERLARKARAAGVDVTFEEWPQMVHVWHLLHERLPQARAAIAAIGRFIRARTARAV